MGMRSVTSPVLTIHFLLENKEVFFGRRGCRLVDFKVDLKEKVCVYENVHWSQLVENRYQCQALVNTAMNIRVQQKTRNVLRSRATISFSRRPLL